MTEGEERLLPIGTESKSAVHPEPLSPTAPENSVCSLLIETAELEGSVSAVDVEILFGRKLLCQAETKV